MHAQALTWEPTMTQRRSFMLLTLLVASTPSLAQQDEPSFKSTEVTKGLFMIEGVGGFVGGNLACIIHEAGPVIVMEPVL